MDVIEAIHGRRSIRAFAPRLVARDLVEAVILDAAQAPPPFRDQVPWTFSVVQGVERIADYGAQATAHARANRDGPPGSIWLDRPDVKVFWDAPVVIVISGQLADCCRAGQNMMLSAHARGLGTCWVGSPLPWLRTPEAMAEFRIPAGLVPQVAMCLGYASEVPPPPPRGQPEIIWVD